jgi:hypothetical protein
MFTYLSSLQRSLAEKFPRFFKRTDTPVDPLRSACDDLDFVESPEGLGIQLWPVQRVILRVIFGVPFDYKPGPVAVMDSRRSILRFQGSEAHYLRWKAERGESNISDWRDIVVGGTAYNALFLGRRSGKGKLAEAFNGVMLRRALTHDLHSTYKLRRNAEISLALFGWEAQERLLDKVRSTLLNSKDLEQKRLRSYPNPLVWQAPNGTGIITVLTPNEYAAKGLAAFAATYNECGGYTPKGTLQEQSLFDSSCPALSNFWNSATREQSSKALLLSSGGCDGAPINTLFEEGMNTAQSDIFAFTAATAEVNRNIPPEFYERMYRERGDASFEREFGVRALQD